MNPEIKAGFDEVKKLVADMQAQNDRELAELKKRSVQDPIGKEMVEKMNADVGNRIDELNKKIAALQTAQNRAMEEGQPKDSKLILLRAKQAQNFLHRTAVKGMPSQPLDKELLEARKAEFEMYDEYKGLSVDNDPYGGYLVRPEISNRITAKQFETSPMRELCDQMSLGTADAFEEPYDDSEPTVAMVSERQTRSTTSPAQLNQIVIPVHEIEAMPAITQKLIDDAAFNVEEWHARKVAEKFGRQEAYYFINGSGVNQPKGILSYTSGDGFNKIEQVISGSAATLTADGLINLQQSLYEVFQPNATWLMRRATAGVIRLLKDGANRYLWSAEVVSGSTGGLNMFVQQTLLGRPLRYAADMPACGSGTFPVAYGDFKQGYLVVDRIGIRVLRDPFTSKGNVLFYTTKRFGGGVRQFQAIKLQKCSA